MSCCCKKNNSQEIVGQNCNANYAFIVLIIFILLAIVLGGTRY